MTARAQEHELRYFESLGARGVITKPFSPKRLCEIVRRHLENSSAGSPGEASEHVALEAERDAFRSRLHADYVTLASLRKALSDQAGSNEILQEFKAVAHKLAGAAACFGFGDVSEAASTLERIIPEIANDERRAGFDFELKKLLDCLTRHASKAELRAVN